MQAVGRRSRRLDDQNAGQSRIGVVDRARAAVEALSTDLSLHLTTLEVETEDQLCAARTSSRGRACAQRAGHGCLFLN